ncbi:MAG: hypothetical protein ACFNLL_07745 [Bacteroides sp.]
MDKNFWGVFMKYSYKIRLAIVSCVKQGEAIAQSSKKTTKDFGSWGQNGISTIVASMQTPPYFAKS